MIIANSALRALLAIYHLISNARSWNNCKIVYEYLSQSDCSICISILVEFYQLTIRLWARDFYEVIVDEAEGRIKYHLIEVESE